MLQRVSFRVAADEVEGILHVPDGATAGGVAVLADADPARDRPQDADGGAIKPLASPGSAPTPRQMNADPTKPFVGSAWSPADAQHVVAACDGLAGAGVAALRFAFRPGPAAQVGVASALADAGGAIRLLKSHPHLSGAVGVVGFGFGGAVAAIAAGRDSRVRCAVLAGAPAVIPDEAQWRPIAELSRTRARVLLLRGSRDSRVAAEDLERYASVLAAARVTHRVLTIDGADHHFAPAEPRARALEAIAAWARESF